MGNADGNGDALPKQAKSAPPTLSAIGDAPSFWSLHKERPRVHIVLSPLELLEKLAALVSPPRVNLVRYHGVLAPNAKDRDKIVPAGEKAVSAPASGAETDRPATRCYRLSWSALLARIFSIDACQCECGGRMKIVSAVTDPSSVRRYLEGVGLPGNPPPIASARPPPQLDLDG